MSNGIVFDIDTFAVHDGPGIRMAVYQKGCPLECAWCHSPESQSFDPELIFLKDRCTMCGTCVAACQENVHIISDDRHKLNRAACTMCGACTASCPTGALAVKGFSIDSSEIVDRAKRLKPFFRHSGGGITLTGGEVTAQPEFAVEILKRCSSEGIHTAVETCGACGWDTLRPIADRSDLILYDIKLADTAEHRRWTGADNHNILENLRRLAAHKVCVRVPLIPGITDSAENLNSVEDLAAAAGISQVEHLPFNESAVAKYEWLGRQMSSLR